MEGAFYFVSAVFDDFKSVDAGLICWVDAVLLQNSIIEKEGKNGVCGGDGYMNGT